VWIVIKLLTILLGLPIGDVEQDQGIGLPFAVLVVLDPVHEASLCPPCDLVERQAHHLTVAKENRVLGRMVDTDRNTFAHDGASSKWIRVEIKCQRHAENT